MSLSRERSAGDVLEGRYRLVERVGQGGFGDVWRAEELLPDGEVLREVALKLLHAAVAADQDWSAEARIIASLRHEALVTIYAAGVLALEQAVPFVAMELLIGESLAERVGRDDRVSWRRVLAWARQAAGALDVIHLAGVVHLDLKPANLFLDQQGQLKVLDFGIAQQGRARTTASVEQAPPPTDELSTAAFMVAQDDEPSAPNVGTATVSRSVVGTPGFMAPEVFEGGEATHAADAYALACCMVQLATGKLPQQIETRPPTDASSQIQTWFAEVQAATVRGRLRDLAAEHRDLPAALIELLLRWLSLDPMARQVHRGELHAQLDRVWRQPGGVPGNPYRGLQSYGGEHEGTLFGRGDEAARVARDLADQPCAVLHGPPGAGLRSLAAAGVVPELARSFADGCDNWVALQLPCAAGAQGLSELLAAWLDQQGAVVPSRDGASAEEVVPAGDDRAAADPLADEDSAVTDATAVVPTTFQAGDLSQPLVRRLASWLAHASEGLVVIASELEAVGDAHKLLAGLIELTIASARGLRFVGTLREEHVATFIETPIGERLRPWLRYVSPPPASAAREIVHGPLLAAGLASDGLDAIDRECQAELSADGARLPLISLALHDWFDAWLRDGAKRGAPTAESWTARGGVLGALCRQADRSVKARKDVEVYEIERILLRLVAADGTPLAVDVGLLASRSDSRVHGERALRGLLLDRLIISHDGKVQLSHPLLAERWTWLVDRRLHDLERLAFLEQLRQAAVRWLDAGRHSSELWQPERLREYRRRRADLEPELNDDELQFVHASAALRRRGLMLKTFAALCVLAVLFGAYWTDRTLDERAQEHRARMQAARQTAALGDLVTRSRRTDDPYFRVALLAGAVEAGSTDPVLPVELLRTARQLAPARFLTLHEVEQPQFPWDERWLIGISGADAVVFDFRPLAGPEYAPQIHHFRPHQQGVVDIVALPYDSSFVSRGLDGQLKVWRLRDSGDIALAAISPMRCTIGLSQILAARRAPVIACATDDGVALWDLRTPERAAHDPFTGRVLEIAPDGGWLVAARLSKVLLWNVRDKRRHELDLPAAPNLARFSPRDQLVALVRKDGVELFSVAADPPELAAHAATLISEPVDARFSDDGLNLAICEHDGGGEWHYLRKGGRPADSAAPDPSLPACVADSDKWPRKLPDARAYGDQLSRRQLGPRAYSGGWMLSDRRFITRDLVMFDAARDPLTSLISYLAVPEQYEGGESTSMVVRAGDDTAWQVGSHVRLHDASGHELLRRKGQLLAHCPDGRVLARRINSAGHWELFGVRSDVLLRTLERFDGFFLGADPDCIRVFAQRLDGGLMSALVQGEPQRVEPMQPLNVPGGAYVMDGYVYDVRPSARNAQRPAGLWLAFSSGALVRVGADGELTPFGSATPRASAMADGPTPLSLLLADDTGVVVRELSRQDQLVLLRNRNRYWEDILATGDGRYAWLGFSGGVALLDLQHAELLDEVRIEQRGRLAAWSDDGAILSWPFAFMGNPRGSIIPAGRAPAKALAAAASNLRATLTEEFDVRISLADQ